MLSKSEAHLPISIVFYKSWQHQCFIHVELIAAGLVPLAHGCSSSITSFSVSKWSLCSMGLGNFSNIVKPQWIYQQRKDLLQVHLMRGQTLITGSFFSTELLFSIHTHIYTCFLTLHLTGSDQTERGAAAAQPRRQHLASHPGCCRGASQSQAATLPET